MADTKQVSVAVASDDAEEQIRCCVGLGAAAVTWCVVSMQRHAVFHTRVSFVNDSLSPSLSLSLERAPPL